MNTIFREYCDDVFLRGLHATGGKSQWEPSVRATSATKSYGINLSFPMTSAIWSCFIPKKKHLCNAFFATESLLKRTSINIAPPPCQLDRHITQSLGGIRGPRPLLHGEHMRGVALFREINVGLRLVIQPGRVIPDGHVVLVGITEAGCVGAAHAHHEGYLGGLLFAEELGVDVLPFAVLLFDALFGVGGVAGVGVPADAEQVTLFELDFLAFEGVIDGFGDVSLQSGYVLVLPPGGFIGPEDLVKRDLSTWLSI